MKAKTLKFTLMNLGVLLLFFCKSSADQPTTDYNILSFLNSQTLNGFYWDGIGELSSCTTNTGDPSPCLVYQENYKNFIKNRNKNLYIYVDSLQGNGKITLEIANPDDFSTLNFQVHVIANITTGQETGNGYARVLNLSNNSTISLNSINLTLNNFSADVLEDGLRGVMVLNVKSQNNPNNNLNLTISFNIKKIL